MAARTILASLFAGLSACADGGVSTPFGSQNPLPEVVRVSVEPQDLTTNVGLRPIEVTLWRNGPEIDDATVHAVAAATRLTQDDETLAATIEILPPPPAHTFLYFRRSIRITPQAEVRGWYDVRVKPPVGTEGYVSAVSDVPGTGELRARLNSESAPVIRYVQLCEGEHGLKASVGFSESVALGGGNGDALTVDVGGSICVPVQGAPNGSEAGGMVEQVEVAYLTCVGTLESDVEVRLSALTSMEGVPVVFPGRDGSVRSLALRWPDAMMPEPACRRWSF